MQLTTQYLFYYIQPWCYFWWTPTPSSIRSHHLITVPVFTLTIYTPAAFHSRLKTHLFRKFFLLQTFWFYLDYLHRSWTQTRLTAHRHLFVSVSSFIYLLIVFNYVCNTELTIPSVFQSTLNSLLSYIVRRTARTDIMTQTIMPDRKHAGDNSTQNNDSPH